jgi:hypothetical protein
MHCDIRIGLAAMRASIAPARIDRPSPRNVASTHHRARE